MAKLLTTGAYSTTEKLIDEVWTMNGCGSDIRAIKSVCKVSEGTINKILKEYEPSDEAKLSIVESKIFNLGRQGHNVDYLEDRKKELEEKIKLNVKNDKSKQSIDIEETKVVKKRTRRSSNRPR